MGGVRVFVADVSEGGKPVYRYVGDATRQPYFHEVGNARTVTLRTACAGTTVFPGPDRSETR